MPCLRSSISGACGDAIEQRVLAGLKDKLVALTLRRSSAPLILQPGAAAP
jgi:hypothetical protein